MLTWPIPAWLGKELPQEVSELAAQLTVPPGKYVYEWVKSILKELWHREIRKIWVKQPCKHQHHRRERRCSRQKNSSWRRPKWKSWPSPHWRGPRERSNPCSRWRGLSQSSYPHLSPWTAPCCSHVLPVTVAGTWSPHLYKAFPSYFVWTVLYRNGSEKAAG